VSGTTIRVVLPSPLSTLARSARVVEVQVEGAPTQRSLLDALEARYPVLRGTIREPASGLRRPFIRFFACEQDLSGQAPGSPLPGPVVSGKEPFIVVGAIAGG